MIESDGTLRCDNCNKKLAVKLNGYLEIICTRCNHFNIFETDSLPKTYKSHELVALDKVKQIC